MSSTKVGGMMPLATWLNRFDWGYEYRLVEALGEAIATAILQCFPVEIVTITIRKIAPIAGAVDHTGVRLRRARVE